MIWKYLADIIAFVHGLWAVIVITGPALSWRWPKFRIPHLIMMGITIIVILLGRYCPLTQLENVLRDFHDPSTSYSEPFLVNYLAKLNIDIPPISIFVSLFIWLVLWSVLYFTLWPKINRRIK